MSLDEAKKTLDNIAEKTITPGFIDDIEKLGLLTLGIGIGTIFSQNYFLGGFTSLFGLTFIGIKIWIHKKYDIVEEKSEEIKDGNDNLL